jgi:hypothetical protein
MMKTVFDVVDLLQLQEIWVRRPIVLAFSRLEQTRTALPCEVNFSIKWLTSRLALLRNSTAWRHNKLEQITDPAQLPMCKLSDEYLSILYTDVESPAALRRSLFQSVYNHFVIMQYQADTVQTHGLLHSLATVRSFTLSTCFNDDSSPLEGSNTWIPVDLVDEIRSMDGRYKIDEVNTPATYVISDDFWPLLVKAQPEDLERAASLYRQENPTEIFEEYMKRLNDLADLARTWNRSPSVVGLYYQTI